MTELLETCPLAGVGKAALAAPEPNDVDPLLQEFNAAIAPYSTERQNMNWPSVERVATALSAQRRDLKVYGYLGLAAFQNDSEGGSSYLKLAALLYALGELVGEGWSRCLPKNEARRQGQLKWFSEEIAALVKTKAPKPAQQPAFAACVTVAEHTAEVCGTAMGLSYPVLRELRDALKEHERALPPPPKKSEAAPIPTAPPAAPPSPPPVSAPQPASPPITAVDQSPPPPPAAAPAAVAAPPPSSSLAPVDASSLTREALEDQLATLVVQLASQLRSESLTDPAPYWLLRSLRWANHDLLRPERVAEVLANKGRSQIPLPQGHARLCKDLSRRLAAGQHAAVVTECEELFAMNPLWLDLQRFIAMGLEGLGADQARAAIRTQVELLLRCCPQIAELRFADRDATPFADAETVRWLESERATTGTGTGAGAGSGPATSQHVTETGHIPEGLLPGVQFLQKQIEKASSGANRFEVQLRLVELLLSNERSDIAMPIVDLLLAAIETHHLAEWQPELCQRALRLAVQTARAAELDSPRRAILWSRVCQLAPADAVQLGPESLLPS